MVSRRSVVGGRRRGLGLLGTGRVGAAAVAATLKVEQANVQAADREVRLSGLEAQQPVESRGAATPPIPSPSQDQIAQLRQLAELRSSGVLTETEFQREKARTLG